MRALRATAARDRPPQMRRSAAWGGSRAILGARTREVRPDFVPGRVVGDEMAAQRAGDHNGPGHLDPVGGSWIIAGLEVRAKRTCRLRGANLPAAPVVRLLYPQPGLALCGTNLTVRGQLDDPTARVTVERRLNNNLSVTYSTDITTSKTQIVVLEYFLTPDYSLVASRDENGHYGLDLRIQRKF